MKLRGGLGLLKGCEIEACCFNTRKLTIKTDRGFQVLAISESQTTSPPFLFYWSVLQYSVRLLVVMLES